LFNANLNKKQLPFSTSQEVDLRYKDNYNELISKGDNDSTPETDTDKTRYVSNAVLHSSNYGIMPFFTGGSRNSAVGLVGLKKQKQLFDQAMHSLNRNEVTPEQNSNMDYGTKYNIDAMDMLVAKVLPLISVNCAM
jgi:hypothetical protein